MNEYVELYNMDYDDGLKEVLGLNKKKKGGKKIKREIKMLKKQTKQFKKFIQLYESQETEKQNKVEKPKMSFCEKIGDAIVKAIPTVLTAIVGTVMTFVFKGRSGRRTSLRNWAVGYN